MKSTRTTPELPSIIRMVAGIAFTATLLLAGCGAGPAAVAPATANVAIGGHVHGGQQPVTGAAIALFATTSAGYGGMLTPLATTATDAFGDFTITTQYTCPADQQAYIVAAGGNPGAAANTDNSAIFLVAALGPCLGIGPSTVINIDEVTTVAAAYALSGFAPVGGAGITEAALKSGDSLAGITTSPTNVKGLADAFANANNIVNYTSGVAYTTTANGAGNGVVPQAVIHALADILQPCVNTTGPGESTCPALFAAATPPDGTGIAAPANVFQAALDIARFPANHVGTLFDLLSPEPAFATTLSTAPNDWTIGITYTNSLLTSASGLGVDAADNVYVAGTGYLIDFSPQGAPLTGTNLTPSVNAADPLREVAFDAAGNLFISDGNVTGVYEYQPTGGAVTLLNFDAPPALDTDPNTYSIAVDGLGDVWTNSYSKSTCSTVGCTLVEFPSTPTLTPAPYPAYTPFATFNGFSAPQPSGALGGARGMAFDVNTGNIWITAIDDNLGELFRVTPSANGVATASAAPIQLTGFGLEAGVPASNTAYGTISVAVDSTSRAWFVVAGGPSTTGSKMTPAVPGAIYPVSPAGVVGAGVTGGGLNTPTAVAIDGDNNLFVANGSGSASASSVIEYSPALAAFLSPASGFIPSSTGVLYEPSYLAVDRSGALWTLSSGNGTTHAANLLQILGVAAPVNPVLSAGQYGTKP